MKIPTIRATAPALPGTGHAEPQDAPPVPPRPAPNSLDIRVTHTLNDVIDMFYLLQTQKVKPVKRWFFTRLALFLAAGGFLGWNSVWFTANIERTVSTYFADLFSAAVLPLLMVGVMIFLGIVLIMQLIRYDLRQKIRVFMRKTGHDLPLAFTYRLEPAGVVRLEEDLRVIVPWGRLHTLQQDEKRFLFVAPYGTESILIPRKDLTPEEEAAILEWEAYRQSVIDPPHAPAVPENLAGEPRFRSTLPAPTLEDMKGATLYAIRQFSAYRNRYRAALPLIIVSALFVPVAHIVTWAMDPYRLPLDIAFPLFVEMLTTTFVMPTVIIVGVILLSVALTPLFWRVHAGQYAKKTLGGQASLSGYEITVGPSGIRSAEETAAAFYGWSRLTDFRIVKDAAYMSFARGFTFNVPLTSMTAEEQALLQQYATQAPRLKGNMR